MARSVADAALMLGAMTDHDPRDPLSHAFATDSLETIEPIDLSTLRVAISPDLGFARVDDGIRETFAACIDEFRPAFGECVDPNVISNVEAGLAMKPEDIGWALAEEARLFRDLQSFFDDVDVLVCPTVAVPPFPVEQLFCTHINGVELDNYIQWADLTSGLTITGHPIVSIPCGLDPTGTPFGLQIVWPRKHSERFLIAVAAAMERYAEGRERIGRPSPDIGVLSA